MQTQLMFYESAVPVASDRHARAFVDTRPVYPFAARANSVPLTTAEFALAARDYPVVFARSDGVVLPVVLLGGRQDENLFIDGEGRWAQAYVPAFVRRYPFIFADEEDGQRFTLCIDEASPALNWEGRGHALFSDDGQPTAYVQDVLRFLQEYRFQYLRTRAFGRVLDELELLQPMQARFDLGEGQGSRLGGFWAVDRERLQALRGPALEPMMASGQLEAIFLHLQSLANFDRIRSRLAAVVQGAGAEAG